MPPGTHAQHRVWLAELVPARPGQHAAAKIEVNNYPLGSQS
jgi:hypothetical protein